MKKMGNKLSRSTGFTVIEIVIVVFVIAVLGLISIAVFHSNNQSNKAASAPPTAVTKTTSPTTTNAYAVLRPATVPSKAPECSQTLTYESNGDSEPVECSNGDLNILEWNALAALEPEVMSLGYNVTAQQVQSALCADATDSNSDANTNSANVIEATTYQITALYYGWSFASNPSTVLTNGTC